MLHQTSHDRAHTRSRVAPLVCFGLLSFWICQVVTSSVTSEVELVDEWAVHVVGGEEHARRVARDLGFDFAGKVSVRNTGTLNLIMNELRYANVPVHA